MTDNDNLSAKDTVQVTVGNPNCTGQLTDTVLTNLRWNFSWVMELNIEIARVLPMHSRMQNISIKRDNSTLWLPVMPLNPASPDYRHHTWDYGNNLLVIYPPDSNMLNDTPDIRIQYCR
jgi:hypothetical protein